MASEQPECPDDDVVVWETYARKVPETSRPVAEELFRRVCREVQARQLPWKARVDGDTIGFKAPDGETFKVAIHVGQREGTPTHQFKAPSLLIHPRARLSDLGEEDPYPDFNPFWESRYSAQGWNVAVPWRIPDVAQAVHLATKYGRA